MVEALLFGAREGNVIHAKNKGKREQGSVGNAAALLGRHSEVTCHAIIQQLNAVAQWRRLQWNVAVVVCSPIGHKAIPQVMLAVVFVAGNAHEQRIPQQYPLNGYSAAGGHGEGKGQGVRAGIRLFNT